MSAVSNAIQQPSASPFEFEAVYEIFKRRPSSDAKMRCPICNLQFSTSTIEKHADSCLQKTETPLIFSEELISGLHDDYDNGDDSEIESAIDSDWQGQINYIGEAGIDTGGLSREFYAESLHQIKEQFFTGDVLIGYEPSCGVMSVLDETSSVSHTELTHFITGCSTKPGLGLQRNISVEFKHHCPPSTSGTWTVDSDADIASVYRRSGALFGISFREISIWNIFADWEGFVNEIEIDHFRLPYWMTSPPAPDSVIEFVSCKCKQGCENNRCSWMKSALTCTDLCKCTGCKNGAGQETVHDTDMIFMTITPVRTQVTVGRRATCFHKHFVILARKLFEENVDEAQRCELGESSDENVPRTVEEDLEHLTKCASGPGHASTLRLQFLESEICVFKHLFFSCTSSGLFNVCNKNLVSISILLKWCEFLEEGVPVTNKIEAKLRALLMKKDKQSYHLEDMLKRIQLHMIEKATFAHPLLAYRVRAINIPPIIAPEQRIFEMNTEAQKQSVYLKDDAHKKGDAIILAKFGKDFEISMSTIDQMAKEQIMEMAKYCKLSTSNKSTLSIILKFIWLCKKNIVHYT
eukprot:gene20800-22840_t